MAKTGTFKAQFRRRRQGKTNYKKRLALLKSGLHRLVLRKTNNHIIAQLVCFDPKGDKTVVHVNSKALEEFGWKAGKKSMPAAYLTGLLAGKKAKKHGIDKAVLDIGFAIPKRKGWWASALKGSLDAGIEISASEKAIPGEERIMGKHIELFAKMPELPGNAFSKASKKADVKNLAKEFDGVKQKIMNLK